MKKTFENKLTVSSIFPTIQNMYTNLVITSNGYRIGVQMNKKEVKYMKHTHIQQNSV